MQVIDKLPVIIMSKAGSQKVWAPQIFLDELIIFKKTWGGKVPQKY